MPPPSGHLFGASAAGFSRLAQGCGKSQKRIDVGGLIAARRGDLEAQFAAGKECVDQPALNRPDPLIQTFSSFVTIGKRVPSTSAVAS